MSMAMRTKIGDLSADNARGGGVRGGRLLGRWRPAQSQTPANQFFIFPPIIFYVLIFYSISLIFLLHL